MGDNWIYPINVNQPEITISYTIYNTIHDTTRRDFFVRNLAGKTKGEQLAQVKRITNEVAKEMHYLTSYGIDKGTIKIDGIKTDEIVFHNFEPKPHTHFFTQGVLFKFSPTYYYAWCKDNRRSFRISQGKIVEGWQIEVITKPGSVSFKLPVVSIPHWRRHEFKPEDITFFGTPHLGGRKQKKSGYYMQYDREDAIFKRFIERFYEDGNLCFGERRYFAPNNASVSVVYTKWPKSKAKPQKQPRRSVLASKPVDNTEYVYIIRMGRTKHYKIGKSNDPQGRLTSLQTASPYKLKLLHTFKADNATAAEESLHAELHHNRMEGEWFKLSDEQRIAITSVQEYKDKQFIVDNNGFAAKELLNG